MNHQRRYNIPLHEPRGYYCACIDDIVGVSRACASALRKADVNNNGQDTFFKNLDFLLLTERTWQLWPQLPKTAFRKNNSTLEVLHLEVGLVSYFKLHRILVT